MSTGEFFECKIKMHQDVATIPSNSSSHLLQEAPLVLTDENILSFHWASCTSVTRLPQNSPDFTNCPSILHLPSWLPSEGPRVPDPYIHPPVSLPVPSGVHPCLCQMTRPESWPVCMSEAEILGAGSRASAPPLSHSLL